MVEQARLNARVSVRGKEIVQYLWIEFDLLMGFSGVAKTQSLAGGGCLPLAPEAVAAAIS